MQTTKCQKVNVNKKDGHLPWSQTLTTVNEPHFEQALPQPPSVECSPKEVQNPVLYSASEQIHILNNKKIPYKGPHEKDQKTNIKRTKDKVQFWLKKTLYRNSAQ